MPELVKQKKKSVGGLRAYFIRGHGGWFLYFVWFLTNISILYVLLGSQLPIIQELFGNIVVFAIAFVILYVVGATIVGYIDIEIKGIYGQETGVCWDTIPQIQIILKLLNSLAEMMTDVQKKMDELEKKIEELKIK